MKINHVGIAVSDQKEAVNFYRDILGLEIEKTEVVEEQGVKTIFIPTGESEIELLVATDENSPIAKYISKYGPGIQHLALEVDDLASELARLKEKGVKLIDEIPRSGAGNTKIAFLHPKSTQGVLIELCETVK